MKDKKIRPQLGQQVVFTATAQKHIKEDYETHIRHTSFWSDPTPEPVTGVYVGYRRWTSGLTRSTNHGRRYQVEVAAEVWLVVVNPRHNPIAIFADDCRIVEYDTLPDNVENFIDSLLEDK